MALSGSDRGRPVRGRKSSTRIPTVKHEAQIRSITPAADDKPLHERVAASTPAKIGGGESEQPRGKTTRSITRRTSSDSQRTKRGAVPVKKSNPLPLILGVGGGVFLLLIIVIAAASSGGSRVKPPPPPRQEAPPPVVVKEAPKEDIPDTGYVTFVCDGNGSHEEEEAIWGRRCPDCNGRAPFYWDDAGAKFKCWDCKKLFTKSDVTCPKCNKVSFNPRVKPRPRRR